MTQPTNNQFRAEIDRQSALFRTALTGCDEAARVPACPAWAATDLLAHLTEVQAFWAHIVATPITEGSDEMVTVMLGGHPEWVSFAGDGRVVRLAATDTGDEWLVELGRLAGTHPRSGEQFEEASLRPVTGGEPIATISAPAWPLDLWMWNRTDAATVERTGDADALRHVDDALAEGLN